ncbi:MAG: hypothetical protein J1F16_01900 [Muribaculaceae bacterium]|nr:hypothetical protein [Muribaculaceae bacterium]
MKHIRKLYSILFVLTVALSTSCSEDSNLSYEDLEDTDIYETVSLTFNIGLPEEEGMETRAYASEMMGYEDLFDTMVCQVFDAKGNRVIINPRPVESEYSDPKDYEVALNLWKTYGGEEGSSVKEEQIRIKNFKYKDNQRHETPTPLTLKLIKGLEYTVCLWAQRGDREYDANQNLISTDHEIGDDFYQTLDESGHYSLKNVLILNNYEGNEDKPFLNNDFNREAFCFSYKIIPYASSEIHSFQLRRPFAQINFGISDSELLSLTGEQSVTKDLLGKIETGCKVFGTATNYNVSNGVSSFEALGDSGDTGHNSFNFSMNYVPTYLNSNYVLKIAERDPTAGSTSYNWLSMCFVLPPNQENPGVATYVPLELLIDFPTPSGKMKKLIKFDNIPLLSNYRSNIILDKNMILKGETIE